LRMSVIHATPIIAIAISHAAMSAPFPLIKDIVG
jgi:hypothetical protein